MSEIIGNIYLGKAETRRSTFTGDGKRFIKVNLPSSEEPYAMGVGEGVWVEVDKGVYDDYIEGSVGRFYVGELANDSIYYPGLLCGMSVPFEMRGESRSVVRYGWLVDNYGESVW